MPRSRLLAVLSSDPDGPVVRHRWAAFAPALLERGIVLEVVDWPKTRRGRHHAMHRAETADGLVVSSRLLRVGDTKAIRRRVPRLAFDFDDALLYRDSARGAGPSRTRRRRFRVLVRRADAVFAGNAYLAEMAADVGARPQVVPTTVRMPEALATPPPPQPPFVIGWIGTRSTMPYLEAEWVTLSALVASGRAIRLRVVSDGPPSMPPGVAVETVPWTRDGWRASLLPIQAGFAPLPDDPWTRGKCGLKVLQMMSLGRPVVASAVGVQKEQIRHRETGWLAKSREDLLQGLLFFLEDPARCEALGRAAQQDVRARFSVEAWAPRIVEICTAWLEGARP